MKYNKFLIKSIESESGNQVFLKYQPKEFDMLTADYSKNPYFKKYGFSVPNYIKDIYSKYSGIESLKYIPTDIYYFYILPYLNNMAQTKSMFDKNNYDILFQGFNMPKTILKKQNGYLYKGFTDKENLFSIDESVDLLCSYSEFIIKPSIESGCGVGVLLIKEPTKEQIRQVLNTFSGDFIVQEIVQQHPILNRLNDSSLNTMRIVTYRRNATDFVHLGTVLRFGRKGAFVDNASAGGRNCKVLPDGTIDTIIRSSNTFVTECLNELIPDGNMVIPNYTDVIEFCYKLHARVPFLNFCGWDIAIDQDSNPIFIEVNEYPDCELIQSNCGPLFGEYTDEILEKVSDASTQWKASVARKFKDGTSFEMVYCDLI